MNIAIIGSGFFGTSCAIQLAKKHKVDIFEKKKYILCGASKANQFRFHLGYHYPRSKKTMLEIKKTTNSLPIFLATKYFLKQKIITVFQKKKVK